MNASGKRLKPDDDSTHTMRTQALFRRVSHELKIKWKANRGAVETSNAALWPHGLILMKSALNENMQIQLLRRCFDEFAFYPHNNVEANRIEKAGGNEGGKMAGNGGKIEGGDDGESQEDEEKTIGESTVKETGEMTAKAKQEHLEKLRWACIGMNYDWTNRTYRQGWENPLPKDFVEFCQGLVKTAGLTEYDMDGEYKPDAGIVNFYTPSQTMGPHRDDAELTMTKPIVSISLGCDAIFCIETKPFDSNSEILSILVSSGDVLIMSGESRRALHGVSVMCPGTCKLKLPSSLGKPCDLSSMRVNINVRQVENPRNFAETFAGRQAKAGDRTELII